MGRQNTSTAAFVPVTISEFRNLYVYSPRDLYIAYGLAFLFSVVCVVIGLGALRDNGLSYSHTFSAVMRATQRSDFDALVTSAEATGADPLPRKIGEAKVRYDSRVTGGAGNGFRLWDAQGGGSTSSVQLKQMEPTVVARGLS